MTGWLVACPVGRLLLDGRTDWRTDGRTVGWTNGCMIRCCSFSFSFSFSCRCSCSLFLVRCSVARCWLVIGRPLLLSISYQHARTHTHKYTSHAATPSRVTEDHGPIELMICGAKCEADSALPLKGNWNFSSPKIVDVFTHFYSRLDPLFLFPPFRFHSLLASWLLFVFWVYSFLTFIK